PREADGQATALAGVGAMVLSADCLPVALASEGAVTMLHAGWRGLAAGVLEQGIEALRELDSGPASRDSSRSGQIVAVVGPGAGACCYEVGPEVHAAFAGAHAHGRRIDLRAIAHERLEAAGVAVVGDVAACTICDERFFSHRREGARARRQAGGAWGGGGSSPRASRWLCRTCRSSPRPACGSSARIEPRTSRRRSPPTAPCSSGTSSGSCRAGACA